MQRRIEAEARPAHRPAFSRNGAAVKRCIDLVLGSAALVALSPVLLVIGLAVRLTSPGPALIRQVRLGYGRSPFVMFKFRTMHTEADDAIHRAYVTSMFDEGSPPVCDNGLYKLANDPRVTPVGRFLRKFSLDELPQLVNVVLGDMSLVGPRPILPWEADLLRPGNEIRFEVQPGITGLWQVRGRNALTMPQALALDEEYVRHRSLGLDLGILLRTIPVILTGRGAG